MRNHVSLYFLLFMYQGVHANESIYCTKFSHLSEVSVEYSDDFYLDAATEKLSLEVSLKRDDVNVCRFEQRKKVDVPPALEGVVYRFGERPINSWIEVDNGWLVSDKGKDGFSRLWWYSSNEVSKVFLGDYGVVKFHSIDGDIYATLGKHSIAKPNGIVRITSGGEGGWVVEKFVTIVEPATTSYFYTELNSFIVVSWGNVYQVTLSGEVTLWAEGVLRWLELNSVLAKDKYLYFGARGYVGKFDVKSKAIKFYK